MAKYKKLFVLMIDYDGEQDYSVQGVFTTRGKAEFAAEQLTKNTSKDINIEVHYLDYINN